jgi:hypothetical protein
MARRPAEPETTEAAVRRVALRILAQKSRGPRFVAELTSSVQAGTVATSVEIEAVLSTLEREGAVVTRAQSHADPHLASADLRMVAPIDAAAQDGVAAAQAQIEALWRSWLMAWLANHKCE